MADHEKSPPALHEHAEKSVKSDAESPESLAIRRKIERRLVWKQDLTMLPLLAMCFFFSYVVCVPPRASACNDPFTDSLRRTAARSVMPVYWAFRRTCTSAPTSTTTLYWSSVSTAKEDMPMVDHLADLNISHRLYDHRTPMLPRTGLRQTRPPI